ncbi:hypothetical protein O9K63_03180 [Janibacter cremeus]|uniref:hypothetical protein n=1 Tax=Janibacter cremeus TaxID=1285192 RepID=UPI0023F9F827|nr:hypothetical protein [Janibacter cremeus]WEV78813.1 hypothetical protein O9K63_03180 [Janibacter cremeus]
MTDPVNLEVWAGSEEPLKPSPLPSVAGSSAIFQSLAWVFRRGDDQQRWTARHLLLRAGVWLPVETYQKWPVLLPWMVRDNSVAQSKTKAAHTGKDLIKTASSGTGLLRSDNAPIGGLKKDLPVMWAGGLHETFKSKPLKDGTHEWMQSHCWSYLSDTGQSTATHPLTNSFVPNLVWLPHAMGRLTDDERLVFAAELRAIAWARYRHVEVDPAFRDVVEQAWSLLDPPLADDVHDGQLGRANEFVVPAKFYQSKVERVRTISSYLEKLQSGHDVSGVNLAPAVYKQSLASVTPETRSSLQQYLRPFSVGAERFALPDEVAFHASGTSQKSQGVGGTGVSPTKYTVHSPNGTVTGLARSQAALRLVHEVIAVGVTPAQLHQVLKANIRHVPGVAHGEALWKSMADAGAPATIDKWYVNEPIHDNGGTWVLKKNSWTQELAEKAFPVLEELSDGLVKVTSDPGPAQHIT